MLCVEPQGIPGRDGKDGTQGLDGEKVTSSSFLPRRVLASFLVMLMVFACVDREMLVDLEYLVRKDLMVCLYVSPFITLL